MSLLLFDCCCFFQLRVALVVLFRDYFVLIDVVCSLVRSSSGNVAISYNALLPKFMYVYDFELSSFAIFIILLAVSWFMLIDFNHLPNSPCAKSFSFTCFNLLPISNIGGRERKYWFSKLSLSIVGCGNPDCCCSFYDSSCSASSLRTFIKVCMFKFVSV